MTIFQFAVVASVAISALSFGYTIVSNRRKADNEVVGKIFGRLDEHDRAITRLESDMAHLPDIKTTHEIQMSVTQLAGKVDTLTERLKPVTAMASRMQEALIEQVKFK